MVRYILDKSVSHEFVSLADKTILGCKGCCGCAENNVCVIKDDWAEVRDKMLRLTRLCLALTIMVSSTVSHAFLERTFSLRHRRGFALGEAQRHRLSRWRR
jgi:multimeric flavodoxin WrbA